MSGDKLKPSERYAVIKVDDGTAPDSAINVMQDAGETFAIVPKEDAEAGARSTVLPALEAEGSTDVAATTGRVTVRWDDNAAAIKDALASEGASLVRDYGKGGVVEAPPGVDPLELAARLRRLPGITSAEAQTLRSTARR